MKYIGSIFVIFIHTLPTGFGIQLGNITGRFAVPFFLIVSAFFFTRKLNSSKYSNNMINQYIIRIFKLFIFWFVLNLPIVMYDSLIFFKTHKSFVLLKYLLTCIFSAVPGYGVSWYLITSMFSAFLLGRLYMKFPSYTLLIYTLPFFLISVITSTYGHFIHSFALLNTFRSAFSPANSIFSGLFFFAIGMYLFDQREFYFHALSLTKSLIITSISFIGMLVEGNLAINYKLPYVTGTTDQFFTLVPFAFFLVVLCFKIPLHLKHAKLYREASTVTYLSQFIFIFGFKFLFLHFNVAINEYLLAVLTILSTSSTFFILYFLESKKNLHWIKYAF